MDCLHDHAIDIYILSAVSHRIRVEDRVEYNYVRIEMLSIARFERTHVL